MSYIACNICGGGVPGRPCKCALVAQYAIPATAIPTAELEALRSRITALEAELAAEKAKVAKLRGGMNRAITVLGNMALENEGAIFNRWPISHEPLRADAKGLVPELRRIHEETA